MATHERRSAPRILPTVITAAVREFCPLVLQTAIGDRERARCRLDHPLCHEVRLAAHFVTEKPNLYADLYRDLTDSGVPAMLGREPKILLTNAGETVPLDEAGGKGSQNVVGGVPQQAFE